MARPTSDIPDRWASDATWTSGDRIGDNTKTEPTGAQQDQGHVGSLNLFGDFSNWLLNLMNAWIRYLDDTQGCGYFGDGSDGNVTISAPTTLTRDMYYENLTIDATYTLNADGHRIFVSDTLTMNATSFISSDGDDGTDGDGGGAGGAGATSGSIGGGSNGGAGATGAGQNGSNISDTLDTIIGKGGSGGAGSSGAGGTAGGLSDLDADEGSIRHLPNALNAHAQGNGALTMVNGGSGGGGGGGDGSNDGGGAGGGGGIVMVAARNMVSSGGSNKIQTDGGSGADGETGGNCGGGGGGGGGVTIVIYHTKTGTWDIKASPGVGGIATGTGVNGSTGAAGTVLEFEV
jgi:hypothetical protein